MQHGWAVIAVALAYFGLLFALASYGDRVRPAWTTGWARTYIFSFSIAVYCTSWTFFGSVGLAATSGLDFLTVYIGPILAFTVASPFLIRVARLAKAQNITSVADFIAARYGKNQLLAAIISVAAIIGIVPYIALQLKAISTSVVTVLQTDAVSATANPSDPTLYVALALATFAILFGTRHIDATEHQSGLMLAIAAESLIKLLAFLAVGIFVTWVVFDGIGDLVARADAARLLRSFEQVPRIDIWITLTLLAFCATFLLPRQFHVTIVENMGERELKHAGFLVPLYLLAINIFVIPLALGGMVLFSGSAVSPDMYVLALPMSANSYVFTTIAFVGGLSAATAMVIVESVALSVMASNNIVVPLLLRSREGRIDDMRGFLLVVRRISILLIMVAAYLYNSKAGVIGLANIGLLSFAAIAQFAPAFFGGLLWRRASGQGAAMGIVAGFVVWTYTLLLPSISYEGMAASRILSDGLFGLEWLKPTSLFGMEADLLVHGVWWSLFLNTCVYIIASLTSSISPMERLQANAFVGANANTMAASFGSWHAPVRVGELQNAVSRYLGEQRTRDAFNEFAAARNLRPSLLDEADIHLVRFSEHLLSSVIGVPSARLALSLLLRKGLVSRKAALLLFDEASIAVQHSRDLLQTALDHARHGVAVYDHDLRLVCWNREFVRLFEIPDNFLRVGKPLDEILRNNAVRGLYGPGRTEDIVADRMQRSVRRDVTVRTILQPSGRVIEIRADDMPDGGIVVTYTDVTEAVIAEKALEARVNERTRELTHLNQELARAKAEADSANYSKTRFLAAASHDILQPLNAARLYVASLAERASTGPHSELVSNVDASLQSVEEIFSILLDISRLDAGVFTPDTSSFKLDDVFRQLDVEFKPLAKEKGLNLTIVGTTVWVRSDRRLLRRLLQNLLSNAIKYTPHGSVLMGVRKLREHIRIEVWDTGIGIPETSQRTIFREFQRLDAGAKAARGLGLGLSIVERIARVLNHKLKLRSTVDDGTVFTIDVPFGVPAATVQPQSRPAPAAGSALSGMRVLCIDNESNILDGMDSLLTGWGCHVMKAASLPEAERLCTRDNRPDIIVVDYHLDKSDGLTVVRELRKKLDEEIPAILVTADRGQVVREGARALGLEVLYKPLRPASLRALLAQMRAARSAAE